MIDKDFAYTAGIIHDIGRLALIASWPEEYSELLKTAEEQTVEIARCEQDIFGMDHCQAGRQLVGEWNLPPEFLSIISTHHDDRPNQGKIDIVAAVRLGCAMADVLGFGIVPSASGDFKILLDELPQHERTRFNFSENDLILRTAIKINALEAY